MPAYPNRSHVCVLLIILFLHGSWCNLRKVIKPFGMHGSNQLPPSPPRSHQLLEDDSTAVSLEAANALAALSDHAGAVKDRLEAGFFAATAEKVALNPVQEAVGALDGVFR